MTSTELLAALGAAGPGLARAVEKGRISPSYLFEGCDADVLREASRSFAALVLCASGGEPGRVERLVRDGAHPDLHVLGKDKATVISVAALSALLETVHRTPLEGARQVFVIDPAEAMEPEGVARYLKALEEPPEGTVFVLLSTRPDRLPATVLSRVRRVRLPPMSAERIVERLVGDGVARERAQRVAPWSGGALARARRLAATSTPETVDALVRLARTGAPEVARQVDAVLATMRSEAGTLEETDAGGGVEPTRRENIRVLVGDVIHVLSTEAREAVARHTSGVLGDVGPDAALDLLEGLGMLAAAVPANVTPAVVLIETIERLRGSLG